MSKILLVDDRADQEPELKQALAELIGLPADLVPSLQAAIEKLETTPTSYRYVVCRYSGQSLVLLDALLQLIAGAPCLILNDKRAQDLLISAMPLPAHWAVLRTLPDRAELREAILRFQKPPTGQAVLDRTLDSDFIRFNALSVDTAVPMCADIYAKIGTDHYVKVFRSEDALDPKVLQEELHKRRINHYYIRQEEIRATLANKAAAINELTQHPQPDRDRVQNMAEDVVEIAQDVVSKVGFTPEIQEVVKRTAQLVIKVVARDGNLAKILERLNQNDKRYIASHSMMLSEVACAIAHRIGWDSPSTYLKISLSALMHDITFKDNELAKIHSLIPGRYPASLTPEQIEEIRLHPVRAAEYAHQFNEMPPDVDSILSQHHERPDGTGFPRGLFHSRIQPLAALFIMAHDVLDGFMGGDTSPSVEKFFEERLEHYSHGTFKKIAQAVIQRREIT